MNFDELVALSGQWSAAWTPELLTLAYVAGVIVTMIGIRLRWPKWSEPVALSLFCWYLILPVLLLMLAWRGTKLGWRMLTWPVRVFARGLKRDSEWEKWSAQWRHITTAAFPLDGDGLLAGLIFLSKNEGEMTTTVKALSLEMPKASGFAKLTAEFFVRQGDKQWPAPAKVEPVIRAGMAVGFDDMGLVVPFEPGAGMFIGHAASDVEGGVAQVIAPSGSRMKLAVKPDDYALRDDVRPSLLRRDVPPEIIDDEEGVAPVREGAPPAYGSKLPEPLPDAHLLPNGKQWMLLNWETEVAPKPDQPNVCSEVTVRHTRTYRQLSDFERGVIRFRGCDPLPIRRAADDRIRFVDPEREAAEKAEAEKRAIERRMAREIQRNSPGLSDAMRDAMMRSWLD